MKQFIYGLAVGLAVMAPAFANSYGMMPGAPTPTVVAGAVNANGVPIGGSGFASQRVAIGQYIVRFVNGRLRGCASMAAVAQRPFLTTNTRQIGCGRQFEVNVGTAVSGYVDDKFTFIVVGQ
jgi:hypothetical protein